MEVAGPDHPPDEDEYMMGTLLCGCVRGQLSNGKPRAPTIARCKVIEHSVCSSTDGRNLISL